MRIKHLFIPLICIVISLTALSGVFALCIKADCDDIREPDSCTQAQWDYEDCLRQERAVKEVREAAERERSGKVEKEAVKGAEEPQKGSKYRFMDDIREINKIERKY